MTKKIEQLSKDTGAKKKDLAAAAKRGKLPKEARQKKDAPWFPTAAKVVSENSILYEEAGLSIELQKTGFPTARELYDRIGAAGARAILTHHGLPLGTVCQVPSSLVMPVAASFVQLCWYRAGGKYVAAFGGAEVSYFADPGLEAKIEQQHQVRVSSYLVELSRLEREAAASPAVKEVVDEETGEKKLVRKNAFVKGPAVRYRLAKGVKLPAGLKGQQELVAGWFKKNKDKSGTAAEIAEALVKAGFKCNQSPERAIYYYLNEWRKKSWLETE